MTGAIGKAVGIGLISVHQRLANELGVLEGQVQAVELLDRGATVPFIASYRKEATGSLSDTPPRSELTPPYAA